VKTTLNLNDALLTRAKAMAAQQRTSLTRLIEEGLQLRLKAPPEAPRAVRLPVFRGKGGLAPGIGGLSNRDMLDAADRDA
jgi:hypothetical protein